MAKHIYKRLTIWEIKTNLHVYLHAVKYKGTLKHPNFEIFNFGGIILHI